MVTRLVGCLLPIIAVFPAFAQLSRVHRNTRLDVRARVWRDVAQCSTRS
jgi:hypothetical protein